MSGEQGIEETTEKVEDGDIANEEETDEVESSEDDEQEELDEETTEEREDESAEEETEDDAELEFKEWIKQFDGMPDGVESEEDLVKAYIESTKAMKSAQSQSSKLDQLDSMLRARGHPGVDNLLTGGTVPQSLTPVKTADQISSNEEPYFDTKAAASFVKGMTFSGDERGAANRASYEAVAHMVDGAYGAQFAKNEQALLQTNQVVQYLLSKVRDSEWSALPEKTRGGIDRKTIDGLVAGGQFKTYDEAIRFHLFNQPDLLTRLTEEAKTEGKKQGLKRRRQKSIRRSKTRSSGGGSTYDYNKYIMSNGDWDQSLMQRDLKPKQRKDMLDAYMKEHFNE